MQRRHPQNPGRFTTAHARRARSSGNVGSGHPVRVVLEAARRAAEKGLAFAVLLFQTCANMRMFFFLPRSQLGVTQLQLTGHSSVC